MANIKVNGSGMPSAVNVATDVYSSVHYPLYKIAYSLEGAEPVQVSASAGLPVTATVDAPIFTDTSGRGNTKELLHLILLELRINSKHLECISGETFTTNDVNY